MLKLPFKITALIQKNYEGERGRLVSIYQYYANLMNADAMACCQFTTFPIALVNFIAQDSVIRGAQLFF